MNISVTKLFQFDAAHKLPQHDGKCRQLHGHTYTIEVTISGPLQLLGPSHGMVIDFAKMTTFWKQALEPQLDHQYLNETFHNTPTAEFVAVRLAGLWMDWCESFGSLKLERVKVWETPTSYAEVVP